MDDLRIDSHKLMYHPERVAAWLRGETVYPVYMEISPTGRCNQRCVFCAFDYVDYPDRELEPGRMFEVLEELASLGVKSIMYAGEGEPFLHRKMAAIIAHTRASGIDAAVATNGSVFTRAAAEECMSALSWIRVSMNAGTPSGYATVHGTTGKMFQATVRNIKTAVEIKNAVNPQCRIGAQIVLVRENMGEVLPLASLAADIGLDYLTVKPYIPHPLCLHGRIEQYSGDELKCIEDALAEEDFGGLRVFFRRHGFEKLGAQKRVYTTCHGVNFFAEITSDGNVYTCGPNLGLAEFCYGNIYEKSFKQIWEGEARRRVMEKITTLDPADCMTNCRLDEVNLYLWQLAGNPPEHVNFI